MKTWLSGERTYTTIRVGTNLQTLLSEAPSKWLAFIVRQITEALGGTPTAWQWELDSASSSCDNCGWKGDTVVIGAAL